MKKVLVITNFIGFANFLWNDFNLLQTKGMEIVFAASCNEEEPPEKKRLQELGIQWHKINLSSKSPFSRENIKGFFEIKELIKKYDFDVIHCHTPIVGALTRLAAIGCRRKGTKVIYTTHGLSFTKYSSRKEKLKYYCIELLASLFTDLIITINNEDFDAARKLLCKDVRRINGVGFDAARYHDVNIDVDAYKRSLGIPVDRIVVLSVGELSARKNHQIIIRAIGMLPNKADYIYVICGREVGGTLITNQLKRLAEENGVELYLLGHRRDIPNVMHCSDIGAIPSVREGLGLAGVQSLCAEVPLVGTDVQGIREYIIDDVTGYLCKPYDVQGYAEAIRKLTDKEVRNRMKGNCYAVAKRFDKSVSYKQMKEIYDSVF